MRVFSAGATRDSNEGKLAYNRFLSPRVLTSFCEYLEAHRDTAHGRRDQDNYKSGMPTSVYTESLSRHYHELWTLTEHGVTPSDELQEAINACLFNLMGLSHELIKQRNLMRSHISPDMGVSGGNEHETSSSEIRSRVQSLLQSYQTQRDESLAPDYEAKREMRNGAGDQGSDERGISDWGRSIYPRYNPGLPEGLTEAVRDQYDE